MSLIDFGYKKIVRPTLFHLDPEFVHELVMSQLGWARLGKLVVKTLFCYDKPNLHQDVWDLTFRNPIGLAGGFDKNATCADIWELFGFSFFEIGTVTPRPQKGNPKPRLFRYPEMEAIVNRMGFNNDGSDTIAERLADEWIHRRQPHAIMGVSIGKQKETPADDIQKVIDDYRISLQRLYPFGDFFVVNVSSPNTPDLRSLQERKPLSELLYAMKNEMYGLEGGTHPKPLCVKLAPDLSDDAIHEAVDVALECGVDGIVATNTTNNTKGVESGGLSGKPLRERSTDVIRLIARHTGGRIPLIGCGGIFTAQDAIEKLEAGAWLVQIYTSFVYEGPQVVRSILKGLTHYLDQREFNSISQVRMGK